MGGVLHGSASQALSTGFFRCSFGKYPLVPTHYCITQVEQGQLILRKGSADSGPALGDAVDMEVTKLPALRKPSAQHEGSPGWSGLGWEKLRWVVRLFRRKTGKPWGSEASDSYQRVSRLQEEKTVPRACPSGSASQSSHSCSYLLPSWSPWEISPGASSSPPAPIPVVTTTTYSAVLSRGASPWTNSLHGLHPLPSLLTGPRSCGLQGGPFIDGKSTAWRDTVLAQEDLWWEVAQQTFNLTYTMRSPCPPGPHASSSPSLARG